MTNLGPITIYYWRGQGTIGSIVRHASSSQWGHLGIAITLKSEQAYLHSYPGKGFQITRIAPDNPPQGIQQTDLQWHPQTFYKAMDTLQSRPYSYLNGVLAAFGHRRESNAIQCAQAAEIILRTAGLDLPADLIPEPQGIANEVERLTGHPVKRVFEWEGKPTYYRGIPPSHEAFIKQHQRRGDY